jgi:hypothetical protein
MQPEWSRKSKTQLVQKIAVLNFFAQKAKALNQKHLIPIKCVRKSTKIIPQKQWEWSVGTNGEGARCFPIAAENRQPV